MGNIIDYVRNELRPLREKPFSAVDSLVLSQFTYVNFTVLVPGLFDDNPSVRICDLLKAEYLESLFSRLHNVDLNRDLLIALGMSPRFRDIRMNYFVDDSDPEVQMQFAAVTFLLDDRTAYVAFRGTDGTLIGWKEDFNMAYIYPLPSQEAGLLYLNAVSGCLSKKMNIFVGGHSKGGNIAVYSSMKCKKSIQKRIIGIYNHDGPGFSKEVVESQEFAGIRDRTQKSMPQASVFGILLHHQENVRVVESAGGALMQHDPFSWCIEGDDFCYTQKLSKGSVSRHMTINQWLSTLSQEQRKLFFETLYQLVESTHATSIYDLTVDWRKVTSKILSAAKGLDSDTRKFVNKTFSELVKLSLRNIRLPIKKETAMPVAIPENPMVTSNEQTSSILSVSYDFNKSTMER
jgi:hypothetical protein